MMIKIEMMLNAGDDDHDRIEDWGVLLPGVSCIVHGAHVNSSRIHLHRRTGVWPRKYIYFRIQSRLDLKINPTKEFQTINHDPHPRNSIVLLISSILRSKVWALLTSLFR